MSNKQLRNWCEQAMDVNDDREISWDEFAAM